MVCVSNSLSEMRSVQGNIHNLRSTFPSVPDIVLPFTACLFDISVRIAGSKSRFKIYQFSVHPYACYVAPGHYFSMSLNLALCKNGKADQKQEHDRKESDGFSHSGNG